MFYSMNRIFLIIIFISILLSPGNAEINAQPAGHSDPIRLKYADSLLGSNSEAGPTRFFVGNVHLVQKDVDVTCDRADQYLDSNRAKLIGNVIITQKGMVMKSPEVFYFGNEHIAEARQSVYIDDGGTILKADSGSYSTETYIANFYGNVEIDDDSARIYSDEIRYERRSRQSFAYGNVLVMGKYTNTILYGDTVIHRPNEKYMKTTGHPLLYQIDTTFTADTVYSDQSEDFAIKHNIRYDTLSISSDLMEGFRGGGEENYVFTGNVEINKAGVAAKADSAVFIKNRDIIKLYGTPVVWYDSTQLHGDSISIYFPDNQIELIHAHGNALTVSRDDTLAVSRINQIAGAEIKIEFIDKKINRIRSFGDSKSLYFLYSDDKADGADLKGCDSIIVNFVDGEADNIIWLGGIEGELFPEKSIAGKAKSFYLPSFRFSNDKPVRRQMPERRKMPESTTERTKAEALGTIDDN